MFKRAKNVVIEGGSFSVTANTLEKVNIDRLFDMVAPNAILNAGGRADEVRCFPGTREEVIGKVENWANRVRDGSCKNRMMWLSGPAGAGKSAISQTIAERCPIRQQQAANFFFFRGDQTRNSAQPLVPTLLYQLRDSYPMLDELLANCLKAHPLIFKAPIIDQFSRLITRPMQTAHQSPLTHDTILLIIDGLDECDDEKKQGEILMALRALVDADQSPFLVLIASRAEPHLIMSFNQFGPSIESIFLDDEYRPQDDIRHFVTGKFDEIKRVHHLRHMLSENWPAQPDIEAITTKSSGHFIYAATVMRFIQHSPESPDFSLRRILEMKPSVNAGNHPLAPLDAVYSYIFQQVRDMQPVKLIIGAHFITNLMNPTLAMDDSVKFEVLMNLIGYGLVEVKSLLANLGAIIQVESNPLSLVFYHASLPDYLGDGFRSGNYHVDENQVAAELMEVGLRNFHNKAAFFLTAECSYGVKATTPDLSKSLLGASTRKLAIGESLTDLTTTWPLFLCSIVTLYLKTDRKLFKTLLKNWVCFGYAHDAPSASSTIKERSLVAYAYYQWYQFTQKRKFVLKKN